MQNLAPLSSAVAHPGITFLSYEEIFSQELLQKNCVLTDQNVISIQNFSPNNESLDGHFLFDELDELDELDKMENTTQTSPRKLFGAKFQSIYHEVLIYTQKRPIFIFQGQAGNQSQPIFFEIICESVETYHFCKNIFIEIPLGLVPPQKKTSINGISVEDRLSTLENFTIFFLPSFGKVNWPKYRQKSKEFTLYHWPKKTAFLFNIQSHEQIRKSLFSWIRNMFPYSTSAPTSLCKSLPTSKEKVGDLNSHAKHANQEKTYGVPLHCAANIGEAQDLALFFGLSGWAEPCGKELLFQDGQRQLIADDRLIWDEQGIWNIETGFYDQFEASQIQEDPTLGLAIQRNALFENLISQKNKPDQKEFEYDNGKLATREKLRISFPYTHLKNFQAQRLANHPKSIFFFFSDFSQVLPPIACLDPKQSKLFFLLSLATTDNSICMSNLEASEKAIYSITWGKSTMVKRIIQNANVFSSYIQRHQPKVYLVNYSFAGLFPICNGTDHALSPMETETKMQTLVSRTSQSTKKRPASEREYMRLILAYLLEDSISQNHQNYWKLYPQFGNMRVLQQLPFLAMENMHLWHKTAQSKRFQQRWKKFETHCNDVLNLFR